MCYKKRRARLRNTKKINTRVQDHAFLVQCYAYVVQYYAFLV
jgi:hypothetical protein